MRSWSYMRMLVLATALGVAACTSDTTTGTPPPGPLTVSLLGLPDTLAAGDVAPVRVRVQDAAGHDVAETATLSSSDPGVAVVDGAGRVRAVAAGVATIRASVAGTVGTAGLVVSVGPAQFGLQQFEGGSIPLYIETDTAVVDGVAEPREFYLDSGALTLSGGTHPGYRTALYFGSYAVTVDGSGQRHLVLRLAPQRRDSGFVSYDARGDLVMSSKVELGLHETASPDTSGVTMLYRFNASDDTPSVAVFGRRPR